MNTTTKVERKELGKWLNVLIAKHAKRSGVKNIQAWVLDNFFWEIVDFILKDRAKHATAVRKQVAEEILEEIDSLPHGHTPDGKTHWVSIHDEELETLRQRYLGGGKAENSKGGDN